MREIQVKVNQMKTCSKKEMQLLYRAVAGFFLCNLSSCYTTNLTRHYYKYVHFEKAFM